MMGVDENTGHVFGSFRTIAIEKKGRMEIKTQVWDNNGMCMGSPSWDHAHAKVDTGCHGGGKVHIDGADTVHSVQYSWLPYETTPKIVSFGPNTYRGKIEFFNADECNNWDWQDARMSTFARWYIQQSPAMHTCFRTPTTHTTGGTVEPRSYMTVCSDGENDPGVPVNIYFRDDQCREVLEGHDLDVYYPFDGCYGLHEGPNRQMLGGARLWHSHLLGDMGTDWNRLMCFNSDHRGEDGKTLNDRLAPWNTYKDIKVPMDKGGDHDNNNDNNNDNGGGSQDIPGPGLCGCENAYSWGQNFCNFDDGSSGTCENCFSNDMVDCFFDGLPWAGANDCAYRCFGAETPDDGPGIGSCGCETPDWYGINYCNYDQAQSCGRCNNIATVNDCDFVGGQQGQEDCRYRCYGIPPGTQGPGTGPCGCETSYMFNENFCNYDFGTSGNCEKCDNFASYRDCFADGLPNAGGNDCAWRCFNATPANVHGGGPGPGAGPCGCEAEDLFFVNYCSHDSAAMDCMSCEGLNSPSDCNGPNQQSIDDCMYRCFRITAN